MTDNEIIKALECCSYEGGDIISCIECPEAKFNNPLCIKDVMNKALDLINRQKAEIVRLEGILDKRCDVCPAVISAIKEFAEKLTEKAYVNNYCDMVVHIASIDNLVKEMTEGKNENTP